MDTQRITTELQSGKYRRFLFALAIAIVGLLIFYAGIEIGYMKASFNYRSGESYYRSFGPSGGHVMGVVPTNVGTAHGVSGTVISIDLPTLVVTDRDNTEKVVRIAESTVARKFRDTIAPETLATGDFIVVIGSPNKDDELLATFIRVIPPEQNDMPITTEPLN